MRKNYNTIYLLSSPGYFIYLNQVSAVYEITYIIPTEYSFPFTFNIASYTHLKNLKILNNIFLSFQFAVH